MRRPHKTSARATLKKRKRTLFSSVFFLFCFFLFTPSSSPTSAFLALRGSSIASRRETSARPTPASSSARACTCCSGTSPSFPRSPRHGAAHHGNCGSARPTWRESGWRSACSPGHCAGSRCSCRSAGRTSEKSGSTCSFLVVSYSPFFSLFFFLLCAYTTETTGGRFFLLLVTIPIRKKKKAATKTTNKTENLEKKKWKTRARRRW